MAKETAPWVGSRASLDNLEKRKVLCLMEIKRLLAHRLVPILTILTWFLLPHYLTSSYAAYTILAPAPFYQTTFLTEYTILDPPPYLSD